MNSIVLSASVVFPLFVMMLLGYTLKLIGIFNDSFLKQLNALCFKVFLPTLLFINIYTSDFSGSISPQLIMFAIGCVIATFTILMIVIPLIESENTNRGVMVQGIFRSNYILFGMPIAIALYGSDNTRTTVILIAFVVPLFNLLSVIALGVFSNNKQTKTQIFKQVLKNPLIISSILGFCFIVTGIQMPMLFEETILDIAGVATPLALIVLGGSFNFRSVGKYKKLLSICVISKLIFIPLFFIPISVFFGFRGMELSALMAMFASPTAVSTYTMAQNAKSNDELASQIVVFNSIISIVTIFICIATLKYLKLI